MNSEFSSVLFADIAALYPQSDRQYDCTGISDKQGRTMAGPGLGPVVRNFINSALTRATQRTQRFIRWVRVRLYLHAPWSESLTRLRQLWSLPA